MSSFHSKPFYTPSAKADEPGQQTSSLPPSLSSLLLNRSTPLNVSPPSSFGSPSSSSSSSLASQQSAMSSSLTSSSIQSSFGVPSTLPQVALLPPPQPQTYPHIARSQLPPPSLPHPQARNKMVIPPLEALSCHLSSSGGPPARASTSQLPPASSFQQPPSQPHRQPLPMETATRRHEMKFHELREQRLIQHQLLQQQRGVTSSLPPSRALPPPNTSRKSTTAVARSSDSNDPFAPLPQPAEYPMMSLVIRKRRRRTTPAELAILDAHFLKNALPNAHERELIAKQVDMNSRHIQIWFQNKRQTEKKRLVAGSGHYAEDTGSSSPSQVGSSGPPYSSSSPTSFLLDLPVHSKSPLDAPPKPVKNKENIPPLHRTHSAHLPFLGREREPVERSRSEGVVVINGGRSLEAEAPSRSLSRASGLSVGMTAPAPAAVVGGIMDQVVGRRELPFLDGKASVGGASGVNVWKSMMSDPPSGGLEEYIESDEEDALKGSEDEGGDASVSRHVGAGIAGIRSTQGRHHPSYVHATPNQPSSLSRRLSTTSTASSGSSSNLTAANAKASSSRIKAPSSSASVTTTLARTQSAHLQPTSTPRHFVKTLSHAQISSGRRNPSASHPLLVDGSRVPMRRSASLDWAASRPSLLAATGKGGKARASLDGVAETEALLTRRAGLRKRDSFDRGVEASSSPAASGRAEFGRTKSMSIKKRRTNEDFPELPLAAQPVAALPHPGSGPVAVSTPTGTATTIIIPAAKPTFFPPYTPKTHTLAMPTSLDLNNAKKDEVEIVTVAAEDEECARLLLGLFTGR